MAKMGRPSKYTKKLAKEICNRIAAGEFVYQIAKDPDMPSPDTIYRWTTEREDFSDLYLEARAKQAHKLFEETINIADDGTNDYVERVKKSGEAHVVGDTEHIQRSKLRVDTRKWFISRVLPKMYGDKLTVGGDKDSPLTVEHTFSDDQLNEIFKRRSGSSDAGGEAEPS